MTAHSITGCLEKMTLRRGEPVQYSLPIGDQVIALNRLIGQSIRLQATGRIFCRYCQQPTAKSFGQGYCYRHFMSLAQCDRCMLSPQLCHLAQGTCREPQWAEQHCLQTHYVYLANTAAVKVGITRGSQLPTRWLDQGAIQALPIARVASRHLAGVVEVIFKQAISDKTSWRALLKADAVPVDLLQIRQTLLQQCQQPLQVLQQQQGIQAVQLIEHADIWQAGYPIARYPQTVTSVNFDKTDCIAGRLQGMKGQYLLFDTAVINIRRHTGYQVEFSVDE